MSSISVLWQEKFAAKGSEIADLQLSYLTTQLDTFKNSLEQFASKHKSDIRKNAEFRTHFQQMCARIGVDPLACKSGRHLHPVQSHMYLHAASKGFWAQALGVGDFYYEVRYGNVKV